MTSSNQKSSLQKLLDEGKLWLADSSAATAGRFTRCSQNVLSTNSQLAEAKSADNTEPTLVRRAINLKHHCAQFSIPAVDCSLPEGGLSFGAIHEFSLHNSISSKSPYTWHPPLLISAALLRSCLSLAIQPKAAGDNFSQREFASIPLWQRRHLIVWIGRRCWPVPYVLERAFNQQPQNKNRTSQKKWRWQENCLFINPPDPSKRLWAITQTLRCPSVLGIVADGSGFNFVATRRLQIAAHKHNGFALLMRPAWEMSSTSAAHTRWRLTPVPGEERSSVDKKSVEDKKLCWSLELLKARGLPSPVTWLVECSEDGGFRLAEGMSGFSLPSHHNSSSPRIDSHPDFAGHLKQIQSG